ncbi:response regulator transcription factor [Chryseobacterium sp. MP_3.2]|uniref:response regulator transcription factor n=1 Tax=Chryseobacterium sp. MP_3.2 TaxID=3071712 RepID=UPI002DFF9EC0|nr:DNA-binding NarL/FixJ family response regulator [Chryseobacterium sp. MP_3.2]
MRLKIIIYDNQQLNLDCMKSCLEKSTVTKGYEILIFSNFSVLSNHLLEEDCILLINTSGASCQDISLEVERFLTLNPSLKILIHALNPDAKMIKKLFDKGIKAYLGSTCSIDEFLVAFKHIIKGKIFVSDQIKTMLIDCLCHAEQNHQNSTSHQIAGEITNREKDVLQLICDGLRSKEIAEKLFISANTVETHRRNMMLKFNINKSSVLVKFAMENHLVE